MSAKNMSNRKLRTSILVAGTVLKAGTKKAAKMGISRGLYIEHLMRQDLGMDTGAELVVNEKPSVFE